MNNLSLTKRVRINSVLNILIRIDAIARTLRLQKLVKSLLLLTIRGYQKYLSPHKGFSCAYRTLHQEQSCSSYFHSCIAKQGLNRACLSFHRRLQDCQAAHTVLIAAGDRQKLKSRRGRSNNTCAENNNCINCRDIFDLEFLLDVISPNCNC